MPVTPETKKIIFEKIKRNLEQCCPPMVQNKKGSSDAFEIMGNKPVPYGYKKEIVPGMYFSSVVLRKDSVNFYFFPTYMNPAEFKTLAPTIYKCLKGKTCFHFKKEEQVNEKELSAILKKGIQVWEKSGYMK
jgi:hypothetical protein